MGYLSFITDDQLKRVVKYVLDKGIARKKTAEKKFTANIIDPFGSLFEAAAFDLDHETWKQAETIRQCQKTLQNHVGTLHQKVLGCVNGWKDLGTGAVVDLVCEERKVIAEIKNKYNTVTGGKLADQYYSLEQLVMPKASIYKNYTAYFVNIIPAHPRRSNECFHPSDKNKGAQCPENALIRMIDGASFYAMVTGEEDALQQFYLALPEVIEELFRSEYGQPGFELADKQKFSEYFYLAYHD